MNSAGSHVVLHHFFGVLSLNNTSAASGVIHASAIGSLITAFLAHGDPGYVAACLACILYTIKIVETKFIRAKWDFVKQWVLARIKK